MEQVKPKYKPGDKVIFRPHHANYTIMEWHFQEDVGVVMDHSDLPNVLMMNSYGKDHNAQSLITVDQRDLELW